MPATECIVCGLETDRPISYKTGSTDIFGRECPVCGDYFASREYLDDGIDPIIVPVEQRHILQAWIKRQPLEGAQLPILTDALCADVIRDAPSFTTEQRMDQLLLAYASLLKRPGAGFLRANFDDDYPYAWAVDAEEAQQYFLWLVEGQLLSGNSVTFNLSKFGWARVHALREASPGRGEMVFAATWFDDTLDAAWLEGIKPAIEECHLKALRLKEEIHNEKIDDRIIAGIRSCRFLVADVTGARPAVYYEAGFAQGLGKQVLWTCREDSVKELCFDTRQFSHIVWKTPADLRSQLARKIMALGLSPVRE